MLPKIYKERENYTPEDHYVFISYSHANSEIVYNDLNELYDMGVKFWYDKGLEVGSSEWYRQVEQQIKDSRCVGVVFYLSPYVFTSEAIEKEISYIIGEDNKINKSYFSINIGGKNTTNLADEVSSLPETEKVKRNSKRTSIVNTVFDDALPYIVRSDDPNDFSHIQKVYDSLRKYNITEEQNKQHDELVGYNFLQYYRTSEGSRFVEFGKYPQSEVKMFSIWMKDLIEIGDNLVQRGDEIYRVVNNKYFLMEPIRWRIMKYENKTLYLITDKCIDCQYYHDKFETVFWEDSFIRNWLNTEFYNAAFSAKEKQMLLKIENDTVSMPYINEITSPDLSFDSTYEITPSREAVATDYAMENGAYSGPTGTCYWWYKMPNGNPSISSFVYDNGGLNNYKGAFRVTIKVDLSHVDNSGNLI